jgi:hypothetical protein
MVMCGFGPNIIQTLSEIWANEYETHSHIVVYLN